MTKSESDLIHNSNSVYEHEYHMYTHVLSHILLFTHTHTHKHTCVHVHTYNTKYSLTQDFQGQKLDSGHSQYIWCTSSLLLGW